MSPALGPLQEKVLALLASGPQTTATLEDQIPGSSQTGLGNALRTLGDKGLAEITGTVPPLSPDGRGARSNVWSVTAKGREALEGDAP